MPEYVKQITPDGVKPVKTTDAMLEKIKEMVDERTLLQLENKMLRERPRRAQG